VSGTGGDGGTDGYLLGNESGYAAARFAAFAELFDPSTFRHIEQLGIAGGWRCWEVGAGGTSVVEWLAGRVGASGHVLATDIDTSWAGDAAALGNVEVRRHDVALDPPPEGPFDLVHARLVLVHLPERDRALANMFSVLRPGGRLLVEDADPALQPLSCLEDLGPAQVLANRLRVGFRTLMAGRMVDLAYGRTLPRRLRDVGLADVMADASFPLAHPACLRLETATINLIREQLVGAGIATGDEIDLHLANVASGTLDLAQPPMIAAWGRRPSTPTQLPGEIAG
jgi:SAM-dependent methyltransferase